MKTIFLRVLLLCMGIVFFACNDDDKEDLPEPAELQVSPSKLEFLGNGGRVRDDSYAFGYLGCGEFGDLV